MSIKVKYEMNDCKRIKYLKTVSIQEKTKWECIIKCIFYFCMNQGDSKNVTSYFKRWKFYDALVRSC